MLLRDTSIHNDFDLATVLRNGAVLVDVRTHEEFVGWHLRGALNIPVDELDQRMEAIAQWNAPLLVYSGNDHRSISAAHKLRLNGLEAYDAGEARSLARRINWTGAGSRPVPPQA